MYRFSLVPSDRRLKPPVVLATDASAALNLFSRIDCDDADVLRDGEYLLSVAKTGPCGFWTIYRKDSGRTSALTCGMEPEV